MSNNYNDRNFKQLLDRLQQDSWQLELIISGFAIFGLFTAIPKLEAILAFAKLENTFHTITLFTVILIACYILIFNLLIHVTLRGLWIGALGLRYISGDIEFDKLNYQPKFTKHLKKKIISFDRYVATLENYCSLLFAVSFLLIFYVISITVVILTFIALFTFIDDDATNSITIKIIGTLLICFIFFGSFLVFIDFITQGFLKKKKWLAKIYFPFYRVFSLLTFSFLYRPLVYNFLDNKFTKRLSFFLVPFYVLILILVSVENQKSNYLDNMKYNTTISVDERQYENLRTKDNEFVKTASIQSKVITDPFIKFFKIFNEKLENRIYTINPSLKPEKKFDKRGYKTGIDFSDHRFSRKKRDSLTLQYVKTLNTMYKIKIDSTIYNTDFVLSKNKQKQTGFETYLPTKNLKEGKHILKLLRKKITKKDTTTVADVIIPFWYYND